MPPTDKNITILAATKLGDNLCVAGIDELNNWIRPISINNDFRLFYKDDVFDDHAKPVIALSNIVKLRLTHPTPVAGTPHIEDWEYDRTYKPILIKSLNDSERIALLERNSAKNIDELTNQYTKSLCLIAPSKIISANFGHTSFKGYYQPTIRFLFNGAEFEFKATDLYWRAIGRFLLKKKHNPIINEAELLSILGFDRVFLSIGLSRLFNDIYWPMIVGVHTIPFFPVEIDYNNL